MSSFSWRCCNCLPHGTRKEMLYWRLFLHISTHFCPSKHFEQLISRMNHCIYLQTSNCSPKRDAAKEFCVLRSLLDLDKWHMFLLQKPWFEKLSVKWNWSFTTNNAELYQRSRGLYMTFPWSIDSTPKKYLKESQLWPRQLHGCVLLDKSCLPSGIPLCKRGLKRQAALVFRSFW